MIPLKVIFWVCASLIFYTYILFPFILRLVARNKGMDWERYLPEDPLPKISVLIAAYNEEQVISKKIESVLNSRYPADRLEILAGSDHSSDATGTILQDLSAANPSIKPFISDSRLGKPEMINLLAGEAGGEILVITDANVMLEEHTLDALVSFFKDPEIGLVDSRMINTRLNRDGISYQEKYYISREVRIKYHESVIWGTMMGPFGGCYAVRKSLFRKIPPTFLVDDFFVNMSVLKQGYNCINNPEAIVSEDVSNKMWEEYRRKKRISAGNFQNLVAFASQLFSGKPGVALCFFSHKILRWMVPFLVIITFGISLLLALNLPLFRILLVIHGLIFLIPVIDQFLKFIKIQSLPLRFISHFVLMNLALLAGFITYIRGIESNVWQPTRRNQG